MANPTKPEYPGAYSTEAERRIYAEETAEWSDWIAGHPEDDAPAKGKLGGTSEASSNA